MNVLGILNKNLENTNRKQTKQNKTKAHNPDTMCYHVKTATVKNINEYFDLLLNKSWLLLS